MLEGLEITIFNSKDILKDNEEFRLDSEYYQKEYLNIYDKIDTGSMLVNITKMSDLSSNGSFAAVKKIMNLGGERNIPFIRSGNCGETFINLDDLEYISEKSHINLPKSNTKLYDVMMARKGKIGGASIITKNEVDYNCSENVIKLTIKDKSRFNPFYFTVYFNSKFGLKQIERLSTGNVQPWVSIFQIRKLLIPELDFSFQLKIEELVNQSFIDLNSSKQAYSDAENLLLKEIGLKNFTPSQEPVNIKSFKDSFATSGRLDAEYYQPKYEFIENQIKAYPNGFSDLDDFIDDFSTGYPYKSKSYLESGGIPIIRINNINKGSLDISNAKHIPLSDLNLSEKDIAEENDILISMSGTIGNSCKIPKGIKAVVNQRIMKITPKNFNFEVLPLIINSLVGELQLNRIGTGGVQTNISSNDIRKILIPNIYEEKQQQIADLIEKSFALKKQSEHLLEVAKKAVEIAIEEDEDVAIEYINNQSNSNG